MTVREHAERWLAVEAELAEEAIPACPATRTFVLHGCIPQGSGLAPRRVITGCDRGEGHDGPHHYWS